MCYEIKSTNDPRALVVLSYVGDNWVEASIVKNGKTERLGGYAVSFAPVFLRVALRGRGLCLADDMPAPAFEVMPAVRAWFADTFSVLFPRASRAAV